MPLAVVAGVITPYFSFSRLSPVRPRWPLSCLSLSPPSPPISYVVSGCPPTGGIALPTALGRALGLPPLGACFFGSFVADFGDKAVTFALVTSVLHALPRRTAARFPWALRAVGAA